MTRLKKRITNPMTVIAMFATLSETSAALSLPFLDNKEREIYIWFLISFPFYLLLLFFATLNFNYRSLYAPSDFEKGKHFIKAMDNPERPSKSQDPPVEDGLQPPLSVPRYACLPAHLSDLYIVDARGMSKKFEFNGWVEKIQKGQEKPVPVIVFLTCAKSEIYLKESAAEHSKQAKKRCGVTVCVAYNLSSHGVTVIDQNSPN